MRRAAILLAAVVLGASCTGDPLPAAGVKSTTAPAKPVCERMPAGVPAGFMLVKKRDLRNRDHVATRREYRDADGRLLVYLLGVPGEVGEGSPVVDPVTLVGGTDATLLGGPVGNWALTWKDEFPCGQMSVVGNGFTRSAFEALMIESGLLARPRAEGGQAQGYREWIAVFDVARRVEALDPSTEELIETAGMDHIAVGQAACWKGLPRKLGVGPDAVVAAVYGPSEPELDAVVRAVGREPIFRGELPAYCID